MRVKIPSPDVPATLALPEAVVSVAQGPNYPTYDDGAPAEADELSTRVSSSALRPLLARDR